MREIATWSVRFADQESGARKLRVCPCVTTSFSFCDTSPQLSHLQEALTARAPSPHPFLPAWERAAEGKQAALALRSSASPVTSELGSVHDTGCCGGGAAGVISSVVGRPGPSEKVRSEERPEKI